MLFGPGIQQRAYRRQLENQERADAVAARRQSAILAAQQQAAIAQEQRQARELEAISRTHHEINMDARYPLGLRGRLRSLLPHGLTPCVLVSPVTWREHDDSGAAPLE